MSQQISITIDWAAIHDCMKKIDAARYIGPGIQRIGNEGYFDAFGGTYCPHHYESRRLSGVVKLLAACQKMRHEVWMIVHSGHSDLAQASQVRVGDTRAEYWSVDCFCRRPMKHRTHRGAACRATRYGGTVSTERVVIQSSIDNRVANARARIRQAVKVAILLHDAMTLFAAIGIVEYRPSTEICGIHDGRIGLTGIGWIEGQSREGSQSPTVESALAAVTAN